MTTRRAKRNGGEWSCARRPPLLHTGYRAAPRSKGAGGGRELFPAGRAAVTAAARLAGVAGQAPREQLAQPAFPLAAAGLAAAARFARRRARRGGLAGDLVPTLDAHFL